MRILIIEDDHATAQSMELMMKSEGFNAYVTDLGEEGVDLAKIYDYDLITLDLSLPDINGLEVLRRIRTAKVSTPIMIVSDASDIETKVKTFGGGADDYLQKPFHKDEFVARAHAVIRRSKGHAQAIVQVGEIAVNLDAKTVEVMGKRVHLTGKEYQVLELLALRKGTTITKVMVLNHLYGGMDEPEPKIVDVFVCKLRAKLRRAGADGHLRTVWGRGYVMSEDADATLSKIGTMVSIVGRALNLLSDQAARTTSEVSAALVIEPAQARDALKRLSELGYAVPRGDYRAPAYTITTAGLVEHQKRAANAALAAA